MEVLLCLIEAKGAVVSRDRMIRKVWPDTFVTDDVLKRSIWQLRKTFQDDPKHPKVIETIPKGGYRLLLPAQPVDLLSDGGARDGVLVDAPGPFTAILRRVKWLAIGCAATLSVLAVVIGLNIGNWRDRIFDASRKPIRSVAVLPLTSLSPAEQDYFADGMTEALITELGKVSALRVISRQSVMQYKSTKKSVPQIAHELNVEAVVEGAVVREGGRVRITAQLIQAVPERHLWASSYERDLRDVLALHAELAGAIAGEVSAKLTPKERGLLTSARPIDPEAYAAYLKGRYFWNRGEMEKALASFQEAIKKDPSYAPAYASESLCRGILGYWGRPQEIYPSARKAALKALELDETVAEAHAGLGSVYALFDWDWAQAEREYKRALELNPNSADAHWQYGSFLSKMGRADESIAEGKRAQELDPLSLLTNGALAWFYMNARRYDQAVTQFRRTLDLDPNDSLAHNQLGWTLTFQGKYPDAMAHYGKARLAPTGYSVYLYAAWGQKKNALEAMDQLKRLARRENVDPLQFAIGYAGLGDSKRAFEWLEKSYQARSVDFTNVKVTPFFDSLHSDPRFPDLLRKMNWP